MLRLLTDPIGAVLDSVGTVRDVALDAVDPRGAVRIIGRRYRHGEDGRIGRRYRNDEDDDDDDYFNIMRRVRTGRRCEDDDDDDRRYRLYEDDRIGRRFRSDDDIFNMMRGNVDPYKMLMGVAGKMDVSGKHRIKEFLGHEEVVMETICPEINLAELYKYALTDALQANLPIPNDVINNIHRRILVQIRENCGFLINGGLLSAADLANRLDYQVEPILMEAKRVNAQRKFAFKEFEWRGYSKQGSCYPGFEDSVSGDVVGGSRDNSGVLSDIRQWLVDYRGFCYKVDRHFEEVGKVFDEVKDELKMENLMPKLLQVSHATSTTPNAVSLGAAEYLSVDGIKSQLLVHDPSQVVMVEDIELGFKRMCFTINERGIHRVRNGGTEFYFPCCMPGEVECTVDANVEYSVTKYFNVRAWLVVFSAGLNSAFNGTKTKTFSHPCQLRVRMSSYSVKLRQPVKITISKDQADKFMDRYNQFKQIMDALGAASGSGSYMQALPPGASLVHLVEQYPWLEFIELLRRGGVDAAMEMLMRKPYVLRDLPNDPNNALGVAFEEIQIAKMMAEVLRTGAPLELIAGDGRGQFQYNGDIMPTPEYADAVLRNTVTGDLYAVQFKYTDDAANLVGMIYEFDATWTNTPRNKNYPDNLQHENVRLIGPNDVIEGITPDMASSEIRQRFQQEERIRFTPDDTDVLNRFLNDNRSLLQEIVNSEDYAHHRQIKSDVKNQQKQLKQNKSRLETKQANLKLMKEQRDVAASGGNDVSGLDRGIAAVESEINSLQTSIGQKQNSLQIAENRLNDSSLTMRNQVEERMNHDYRKDFIKRTALKEAALSTAISAAIDGITTFICTCGDKYNKYKVGDISFNELAAVVFKNTAIATARGAAFGLGFSSFTLAAQYATANGSAYAGALTIGSQVATPVIIAVMMLKTTYDILSSWNDGDITTAEMQKAFARTATSMGLNIGGMMLTGALIGGIPGLVAGAGLAIAIGVCDHFLGDKVWSLVFEEDPEEQLAVFEKKLNELKDDVLHSAYMLFNLTEYCTKEELKESYRAAILKYHPDKGGDQDIFRAVQAAYALLCSVRGFRWVLSKKKKKQYQHFLVVEGDG